MIQWLSIDRNTEQDEKGDRTMSDTYHFQVNLGGMLDVLSNHLYKSPDVFLRELLQNGVDAVTLRQKSQPDWNRGKLTITVEPGRRLIFRDNGAGLSEEGIQRFLAVIGQSSKTELVNGKIPEDYIGRFGIGLLSCFMVSNSIVVHTRPAAGGGAHVWTGASRRYLHPGAAGGVPGGHGGDPDRQARYGALLPAPEGGRAGALLRAGAARSRLPVRRPGAAQQHPRRLYRYQPQPAALLWRVAL